MYILDNPATKFSLSDFGIQIPFLQSRYESVFNALEALDIEKDFWLYNGRTYELNKEDFKRAHTGEHISKMDSDILVREGYELETPDGQKRFKPTAKSLPLGDLLKRHWKHCEGTLTACHMALQNNFSYFLGGGMHHSMSSQARGFCIFNDIVIALRKLQADDQIKTAWVIDVDAHKGDGTAELTASDLSIKTLSIHMKEGWPLDSSVDGPWNIPSDIDIPIEAGNEDNYLSLLENGLNQLGSSPDLCIVVSGSDPFKEDELASAALLRLSEEQMLERDLLVYNFLKAKNIPQAYVMAGGYGKNVWKIHFSFLKEILPGIIHS